MSDIFLHTTNINLDLQDKLFETVERSFNKKLAPNYPSRKLCSAIYTKEFSCVGLISMIDSIYYLDKLAVLQEYRGKGLGNSLLKYIISQYCPIIWRSSKKNPFIEFYLNKSTHVVETKLWNLFGYKYNIDKDTYLKNKLISIEEDLV